MMATLTSTSLAVISKDDRRRIVTSPTAREIELSQSFHVLAFTSQNKLVLAQSEGTFTMKEWDDVYNAACSQYCATTTTDDADTLMSEGLSTGTNLKRFIRATVEQKTAEDLYWK
jgi:exosome complex component RRP46